jgi:hypothetical protein
MQVVSNTSPLSALSIIGRLGLDDGSIPGLIFRIALIRLV